jgi:predicted nuclease with TOPRIM domain
LQLRKVQGTMAGGGATALEANGPAAASSRSTKPSLAGAELRNAQKEVASIGRRLGKLASRVAAKHEQLAEHDQSDYVGIGMVTDELRSLEDEIATLETRWLELSEQLED